jgi:hypothetical protein
VITSVVALLALQSADLPFERITPQEAAQRVSACGLGPVTIRYDEELQEDILTARSIKTATDEQLACADKAASYYDLELPATLQPHFASIRDARWSAFFQEQARSWLDARGLLNRIPKYQPGVTDEAAFTRNIESLCGQRAKGAFQSKYGYHAVDPDWALRKLRPIDPKDETFTCLMNAMTVAGYRIGFIGNEYVPKK